MQKKKNPFWHFPSFVPMSPSLDVLLELVDAEVAVVVQLGERLPDPQRRQPGLWTLVPTLFHDLHQGRQDLRHRDEGEVRPGEQEAEEELYKGHNTIACVLYVYPSVSAALVYVFSKFRVRGRLR